MHTHIKFGKESQDIIQAILLTLMEEELVTQMTSPSMSLPRHPFAITSKTSLPPWDISFSAS